MVIFFFQKLKLLLVCIFFLSYCFDGLNCSLFLTFKVINSIVSIQFINPSLCLRQLFKPLQLLFSSRNHLLLLLLPPWPLWTLFLIICYFQTHFPRFSLFLGLILSPLEYKYLFGRFLKLFLPLKLFLKLFPKFLIFGLNFHIPFSLGPYLPLHIGHLILHLEFHRQGHQR